MLIASGVALFGLVVYLAFFALIVVLLVLAIRCLLKYLRSGEVRKEKAEVRKSLGETIREYRHRSADDPGVCGRVPGG